MEGIVILDSPVEVNAVEWLIQHPECDTIVNPFGNEPDVFVCAYAKSWEYNGDLEKLWKSKYKGKELLGGITREAAAHLS